MVGHYLRKRLRTAGLARRLAGFALILLLVSGLVFRFRAIDFAVFTILLAIVAALAAAAMLLALQGLVRVWRHGHQGGGAAVAAFFVALLVAAPFALAGTLALRSPAANFAETDGIAEERADGAEALGAVVGGRTFAARASQVYQAARLVLGDTGWAVTGVETAEVSEPAPEEPFADESAPAIAGPVPVPTPRLPPGEDAPDEPSEPDPLDRPEAAEYRIAAVATSPVLAMPSDVEIRIVEDDSQAYLDLRSVSRFGRRDFGQNRRFIENFLTRMDGAMVGAVAPTAAAAD